MTSRLFLCCCNFFKGDDNTEFYELLGVPKDAETMDIRRAYKSKSLQYHPDKLAQRGKVLTAEDQAQFQRIKEAYDVLIDPEKRDLYDQLGEKSMKWLSDPMSDPEYPLMAFFRSKRIDRLNIFLSVVAILMIPTLVPVLFNLKVDQILKDPWIVIATPLWIIDAVILLVRIRNIQATFNPPAPPEGMSADNPEYQELISHFKTLPAVLSFMKFSFLVVFEVLLAVKLDDDINIDYAIVFNLLFLYELVGIVEIAPVAFMKIDDLDYSSEEFDLEGGIQANEQKRKDRQDARSVLWNVFLRVWLYTFLIIKLDEVVNWSWFLVFLPLWVMIFCFSVLGCWYLVQAFALSSEISEENPDPDDSLKEMLASQMKALAGQSCCIFCCLLPMAILAAFWLSNQNSFSTFYIFLNLYILIGLAFCCLCCGLCATEPDLGDSSHGSDNPPTETEMTNRKGDEEEGTMNMKEPMLRPSQTTNETAPPPEDQAPQTPKPVAPTPPDDDNAPRPSDSSATPATNPTTIDLDID